MKKIILSSLLSTLLVTGLVATPHMVNYFQNIDKDENIVTEVVNRGISIRRLNSTTNSDGSVTKTFSFTVSPSNATSDLVEARVYYKDGSSCSSVVTCSVDNDANEISVTCKGPFGQQIILKVSSMSDKDVSASITIDYLQDWPTATPRYSDDGTDEEKNRWYIGGSSYIHGANDDENNPVKLFTNGIVNFDELFNFDYGIYSKEKWYGYDGISGDATITGHVLDYSNTFTDDMKDKMISAATTLLFKMNQEGLSYSKELIWNLIDSDDYRTQLYNSMLNYDYEDEYSRITLTFDNFILQYSDGNDTVRDIGVIDKVQFVFDITADYSSLATSVTSVSSELTGIDF